MPIASQFQFNDRLFFVNKEGVYEHTNQGIEFIQGPDGDRYPLLVFEDTSSPMGYKIIFAEWIYPQTIVYGGEVSSDYEAMDSSSSLYEFMSIYGPEKYNVRVLHYSSYTNFGNPADYSSNCGNYFKCEGFQLRSSAFKTGETATNYQSIIETPLGVFNDPDIISDALNLSIDEKCVVKGEVYFENGQVMKLLQDFSGFEVISTDFTPNGIGSWNNELVMLGENKMTIGLPALQVDISGALEQIKTILNYPKMFIDKKGHLWFNGNNSDVIVELIMDDQLVEDFEAPPSYNFGRYEVSTDTSQTFEQGENLTIIKHTVYDHFTEKAFAPNHVIDLGEDVFVSSDLGFLRRQKEGLAPVISSKEGENSYYLYLDTTTTSQLFPLTTLSLVELDLGYKMIKTNNGLITDYYSGEHILTELMDKGDGRNFTLKNHTIAGPQSLDWDRSSFGWEKKDGNYVIEQNEYVQVLESGSVRTSDQSNIEISYQGNMLEYFAKDLIVFGAFDTYSDKLHHIRDVETINDSLILFNSPFIAFSYYTPDDINPSSYDTGGDSLIQQNYIDWPTSVHQYKGEPIHAFHTNFTIGDLTNWKTYSPAFYQTEVPDKIHVTKDHHIWLFSESGSCYEIIREQDQDLTSNLKPTCLISNIEIGAFLDCVDNGTATANLTFSDTQNGLGKYNIYLDQELIAEVTNTQAYQLPLSIDDGISQTFEIHVQNQNDLLCKASTSIDVACILDQDDDGFSNELDCNDMDADINPSAIEITNNDIDEDCDGEALVIDEDNDGFNSDEDCDDMNADINPSAIDIPGNNIDEDCDGADLSAVYDLAGLEISIYPNPVTDFVYIESTGEAKLEFQIISLEGKLLSSGTLKDGMVSHRINIEALVQGSYFLKITNQEKGESHVERMAKM